MKTQEKPSTAVISDKKDDGKTTKVKSTHLWKSRSDMNFEKEFNKKELEQMLALKDSPLEVLNLQHIAGNKFSPAFSVSDFIWRGEGEQIELLVIDEFRPNKGRRETRFLSGKSEPIGETPYMTGSREADEEAGLHIPIKDLIADPSRFRVLKSVHSNEQGSLVNYKVAFALKYKSDYGNLLGSRGKDKDELGNIKVYWRPMGTILEQWGDQLPLDQKQAKILVFGMEQIFKDDRWACMAFTAKGGLFDQANELMQQEQ